MIRFLLIAFLFFVSCSEKPAETIDLSDLVKGVGEEDSTDTVAVEISYADSLSMPLRMLMDSLEVPFDGLLPMDTILYLDQFVHASNESWKTLIGNLHYLSYKDSLQTKNAFFNWLDCFGSKCNPLALWEERKMGKQDECIVVFEKEILYLQGTTFFQGIQLPSDPFLQRLEELKPKDKILYVLQIPANKKTRWWIKEDDKWTIKKTI